MTDSNELKQGTLILNGNQQIKVSVNYEKQYFICPFCGKPVTFKKYDEKFKKYSAIIPKCACCNRIFTGITL